MEKIGEITAVKGGALEVTFCRPDDCEHCHACDGGQKRTVVTVVGEGQVGDYAAVELPTGTVVKASLLAYALPLAGLLGGMALGSALGTSVLAAVCGLIGLGITGGIVALTEKKRQANPKWQPVLVRVLPRAWYQHNEQEKDTIEEENV